MHNQYAKITLQILSRNQYIYLLPFKTKQKLSWPNYLHQIRFLVLLSKHRSSSWKCSCHIVLKDTCHFISKKNIPELLLQGLIFNFKLNHNINIIAFSSILLILQYLLIIAVYFYLPILLSSLFPWDLKPLGIQFKEQNTGETFSFWDTVP